MTEYLYLSSDKPIHVENSEVHLSIKNGSMISDVIIPGDFSLFYFEINVDDETGQHFSFSSHFENKKYQIASIDAFPEKKKLHTEKGKLAQKELRQFILKQFQMCHATRIEILCSLNGYEDNPTKQYKSIKLEELKMTDLFYEEGRLLVIHK